MRALVSPLFEPLAASLFASRGGMAAAPVLPGATAFAPVEGTHYPAGATVDSFHPTTATITAATRADGRASFTALKDVTGAKDLVPGAGANEGPILVDLPIYDQDDPSALLGSWKVMRFDNGAYGMLKDAVAMNPQKFAIFIAGKVHHAKTSVAGVLSAGYPVTDGGVLGDTTPNGNNEPLVLYSGATATDARGRTPRCGLRYVIDGAAATSQSHKSRLTTPESAAVHWICSRATADTTTSAGENRLIRAGVNGYGYCAGAGLAANSLAGKGWTLGVGLNSSGAVANSVAMDVYQVIVVRWTGTEMTFAQAHQMAADLQAHFDLRDQDARLYYIGDSRANESVLDASRKTGFRVGKSMGWPDGPLPSNVSVIQFGAGGSTLQQLIDWLPGGSNAHRLLNDFRLDGAVNIAMPEWFHNDIGTGGNTLYSPTTANTEGRVDAFLTLFAQKCGELADTMDEVWPVVPLASTIGTTLLDYARDTAALNIRSAAFVAAAQNGVPARVINPIDIAGVTTVGLELHDKTSFALTGTDAVGMRLFGDAVGSNDYRNAGTSGSNIYHLPDGAGPVFAASDLTHPDGGGAKLKGKLMGDIARLRV